jgi:hypothetical protein
MWCFVKDRMAMIAFKNLEAMKRKIETIVKISITDAIVKSACNDDFYVSTFPSNF